MDSKNTQTDAVEPPRICPACRSQDVKTTSNVVTVASYWRCLACGEVWNAGRRESGRQSRYGWSGR